MIQLTLYDVDLKNGTLVIREGKGNKDRYVPLGSRAIGWIRRYIEEVRPELVMEPDPGCCSCTSSASPSARTG